jgi:hypothetical protein
MKFFYAGVKTRLKSHRGGNPMRKGHAMMNALIFMLALIAAAGCARTQLPSPHARSEPLDSQDRLFVENKLNDVRYVSIEGFEHMKVDRFMRDRIEDYADVHGLPAKKAFVDQFLKDAYALNDRVIVESVEKLTSEELALFLSMPSGREGTHDEEDFDPNPPGNTPQERFINGYRKHAAEEFEHELAGFLTLDSETTVDLYWNKLVASIEASIITKGRTVRLVSTAPLVPFVYAWIWYHAETDDREPHVPEFAQRTVFYPEDAEQRLSPAQINDDWSLLQRYAPVIVQEKAQHPPYDPTIDRFGVVYMQGNTLADAQPGVHTDQPAVYAYADRKRIQGEVVHQLVYALWYPAHPKLQRFDPEAGPMEGWTFRITLNRDNEPVLYESVSNCGCYYKVFPTLRLENRAMAEFETKLNGKSFYLENKIPGKIDVVMPEIVDQDEDATARTVLYYSAGKHQFISVRTETGMENEDRIAPRETYRLLPYEVLEQLPFQGHRASLFDENGLVRQAHRPECNLLAPSGIYHAGHPRQRRTQLIYFDQAEFDDAKLFETYMRLPQKAFTR